MGEASFVKALFFGVLAEDMLLPYPQLAEPEREQVQALLSQAQYLAHSEPSSTPTGAEATISPALLRWARTHGLFGLSISREHSGLGLSASAQARVLQEVAGHNPSLGLLLHTHQTLAGVPLQQLGTPSQRQRYLPALARGDTIAAFALTEHGSGSDISALRTHLRKAGRGFYLSGTKRWVTNASLADLFVVFARTNPADDGHKPQLAALLVDKGPGVHIGPPQGKLGLEGLSVCDVEFDNVPLTDANLLGESGQGDRVALAALARARVTSSALLVGQCRMVLHEAIGAIQKRRRQGRVLSEFPLIKDRIACMLADTYAAESMTYLTAGLVDQRVEDYTLEAALSRVASSEALWRIVNHGMQLAGGAGYMRAHRMERHLRDARGAFVLDGTNETLRCFIALSGLQGPNRKLSQVLAALREPLKGFHLLRELAGSKIYAHLGRKSLSLVHPQLQREAEIVKASTQQLARATKRALSHHGKEVAELQYTQLRLTNIVMGIYTLVATLARTTQALQRRGVTGARRELDLTTMIAQATKQRIQDQLERLEQNDDEQRKKIASRAYTDNGYPFDII